MLQPDSAPHPIRNLGFALLAGIALLVAGCTPGSGGGKASVPELLDPPGEEVLAYVAVPSLDTALGHISDLAMRVSPQTTPPPTLATMKAQIGAMLGDPQLAALDTSKPIVVAVLKPSQPGPIPPIVALAPAKDAAKLTSQLGPLGLVGKEAGGLVALAQTPQALELAGKVRPLYDRIAGAMPAATGRIYADTDGVLAAYGALIEVSLAQLTKTLSAVQPPAAGRPPASLAKILKLEARVVLALLGQVDALQVDLELGKDWIGAHAAARAKPGSELAGLLERSAQLRAPTQSVLEGRKGMLVSMAIDPAGMGALYRKMLDVLSADPDTKDFVTPEVLAAVAELPGCWDGTGAMSIGSSGAGLAIGYEMGVTSEEKFVSMIESSLQMLTPKGAFGSMYKDMGIELAATFQRNARAHGAVPVHALKMESKLSEDAGPAFQASAEQLMSLLMQQAEIAVAAKRGLAASSPAELDRMIDAALAQKPGADLPLKAREVFGGGRQGYVDYDVGSLIGMATARIPAGQGSEDLQRMFANLGSVPPMVAAFTAEGARGLAQLRIPVDLIAKMRSATEAPR